MRWFLIVFSIIVTPSEPRGSSSNHEKPVDNINCHRCEIAKPISELVPTLDTLYNKLNNVSEKLERL